MGCLKSCLVLALLAAVCVGFIGVQVSPAVSELAEVVCAGRIQVEQRRRGQGPAVWCVNDQTGQRHSIKALAVIVASAAFFLAFAIPTAMVGAQIDRSAARAGQIQAQREAGATPTDAIIVAVERGIHSSLRYKDYVELILTFQVNDPYRETYQARTPWLVHPAHLQRVEPGNLVAVKINPAHPQEIYPDVDWSVISNLKAIFG